MASVKSVLFLQDKHSYMLIFPMAGFHIVPLLLKRAPPFDTYINKMQINFWFIVDL